jgi:hypothetical protein
MPLFTQFILDFLSALLIVPLSLCVKFLSGNNAHDILVDCASLRSLQAGETISVV